MLLEIKATTNNDILRRLRYTFDFKDDQMIELFGLGGLSVTRAQISDWLKKEEDPDFQKMEDRTLAIFLNGFIADKGGKDLAQHPVQKINSIISSFCAS